MQSQKSTQRIEKKDTTIVFINLNLLKQKKSSRPDAIAIITAYLGRFTAQLTSRPERSVYLVKVNPQGSRSHQISWVGLSPSKSGPHIAN